MEQQEGLVYTLEGVICVSSYGLQTSFEMSRFATQEIWVVLIAGLIAARSWLARLEDNFFSRRGGGSAADRAEHLWNIGSHRPGTS